MGRDCLWIPVIACVCVATCGTCRAPAQEPEASAAAQDVVVATVGDEAIYAGEVARLLATMTQGQKTSPAARPLLEAMALAEIVDRRLILAYARRTKKSAEPAAVDAGLAKLKAKLTAQGESPADYLKAQSIDLTGLRRQIAWDLVWEKYLARYVTQTRLESYFQSHRREFDGTEISVSHILLKPEKGSSPQTVENLVTQAHSIRKAILSGSVSFADAARKHSAGPSANDGGRLGFIPRRGVMDEAFSRAAFALEAGGVSEPVRTRFGVHLIRCDQIKPGGKELADVRTELEEALARELLAKLAAVESQHTPVRFTGAAPHFKPGTRELAAP